MRFIGDGSLLINALDYTLRKGYIVDYLFCNNESDDIKHYCEKNTIPFSTVEVNKELTIFKDCCTDKLVFSINNNQIIKKPLLQLKNFRFYNIHNGIIPQYRGNPVVCIIFALLNQEKEYGVTLHEINYGIDTGRCVDIIKFKINSSDTFQSIMFKSLELCNEIFYKNLDKIVSNEKIIYKKTKKIPSRLFKIKDLFLTENRKDHSLFKRATNFGVFKLYFKKEYNIIKSITTIEREKRITNLTS